MEHVLARMGYHDYRSVETMFEMTVPGSSDAELAGFEGRAV